MKLKIAIGSNHTGFDFKTELIECLANYKNEDFSPLDEHSVDSPHFAHPVASPATNDAVGFRMLLRVAANGIAITANQHNETRACICLPETSSLTRKHNSANVLFIPARFVSLPQAIEITAAF